MKLHKKTILVLNKSFFPLSLVTPATAFTRMSEGAYHGINFEYEVDEEGVPQFDQVQLMLTVKSMKEWCELPEVPYHDHINTSLQKIRVPSVVICSHFSKIKFPRVQFPTTANVFNRDNYVCGYTGKKLTRAEASVDHILPTSRGGQNTWENVVTCERQLNSWKSDRTPEECGLKLKIKPTRPANGLVFGLLKDEWEMFVGEFKA